MTINKVLLLGRTGQVSTYLQRAFAERSELELVVLGSTELDLSNNSLIESVLQAHAPDLIINPAAYTQVDKAEQDSELANQINREAVRVIAQYCAKTATPLIHYSTDYVFSGAANIPYIETDSTGPTGVYGESKLAGEQAILQAGAPALILRTSWVYSNQGKNFYKTMLALAQSRDELNVVADQYGAPTYAGSIAKATMTLLDRIIQQGEVATDQVGVYHFSCEGKTSWCEFAQAIFKEHDLDRIRVNPISTDEFPTPAKRPAFSVMDSSKLLDTFGFKLPHWGTALAQCVNETRALQSMSE